MATVFVTDTHPLVWYVTGHHRQLSPTALEAFHQAVTGEVAVWIPTVVLWEWSLLIRTGKVRELSTLDDLVSAGFHARAMHTLDLRPEDVLTAHGLRFPDDPFDTLIVATALRQDAPLITKDTVIHRERPCRIAWD